jgi:phage gp29-like protein
VLGVNNGALSAAVATASIDELAGAVLLQCVDEALDQPQKSERMRVLAVRHREAAGSADAAAASCARTTLVSVHDERRAALDAADPDALRAPHFNGKERQVVDVVARWILTGAAPDEIR